MPRAQDIARWREQQRQQLIARLRLLTRRTRCEFPAICYGVPFNEESAQHMTAEELRRDVDRLEGLGNDEGGGIINTIGQGLMIAAPIALFGGIVYATTRGREYRDYRRNR